MFSFTRVALFAENWLFYVRCTTMFSIGVVPSDMALRNVENKIDSPEKMTLCPINLFLKRLASDKFST